MTNIEKNPMVMIVIATAVMTIAHKAHSADEPCPSSDDVPYSTQVGETWVALGARAYCLDGPNARSRAALALYEYNRGRVGLQIGDLADGVEVCFPKYLHGFSFAAERCRAAPVPTESQAPEPAPPPPPLQGVCGNGQREGGEFCDGRDLSGATCATMNLPTGSLVCRADCRGFDAKACLGVVTVEPPHIEPRHDPKPLIRPDEPLKPTKWSVAPDLAGGVMFPLSEMQRARFYDVMGLARAGARFGMGPIEVALHGVIGGGAGMTIFNKVDSHFDMFVAGGGIQAGVPFAIGAFGLTPGAELIRLWMRRIIDMPSQYRLPHTEEEGGMTFLGGYLRTEYRFQRIPRLTACIELAVDFVPGQVADFERSDNFQMKTLGGVSYAAF